MINFMCQLEWAIEWQKYLAKIILDVYVRVYEINILISRSPSLMSITLIQSVEGPIRTKMDSSSSKREFLLPKDCKLGHWCFRLKLKPWLFLGLSLPAFKLEPHHQLSWFPSLQTHAIHLWTCQPP